MSLQKSPSSPIGFLSSSLRNNNDSLEDIFGTPKKITVLESKYSDDEQSNSGTDDDDIFFSDNGDVPVASANLRSTADTFFDNSSGHQRSAASKILRIPAPNSGISSNDNANSASSEDVKSCPNDKSDRASGDSIKSPEQQLSPKEEALNSTLEEEKEITTPKPLAKSDSPIVDNSVSSIDDENTFENKRISRPSTPGKSEISLDHFLMPSSSHKSSNKPPSTVRSNTNSSHESSSSHRIVNKYTKMKSFLISTNAPPAKANSSIFDPFKRDGGASSTTQKRKKTATSVTTKPKSASVSPSKSGSAPLRKSSRSSLSQQLKPPKNKKGASLNSNDSDATNDYAYANNENDVEDSKSVASLRTSKSNESKRSLFLYPYPRSNSNGGDSGSASGSSSPLNSSFSGISSSSTTSAIRNSKAFSSLRKRSDMLLSSSRGGSNKTSPKNNRAIEHEQREYDQIDIVEDGTNSFNLRNPRRQKSLSSEKTFLRKNIFTNRSYDTQYMQEVQKKYPKISFGAFTSTDSTSTTGSPINSKIFSESAPSTPASHTTSFGFKSSSSEISTSISSSNSLGKNGFGSLNKKKSIATLSSSFDTSSMNHKHNYYHEKNKAFNTDLDNLLNAD